MLRAGLAFVCLLASTACDEKSPVGPSVPLNQQFTLAPGEIASIEGASVRLQFVRVAEDSRCPADVFCVWAGDAIVRLRAVDADGPADYELHTNNSRVRSVIHRDIRVDLVHVQPYPFSNRAIDPSEYRATFTATRP